MNGQLEKKAEELANGPQKLNGHLHINIVDGKTFLDIKGIDPTLALSLLAGMINHLIPTVNIEPKKKSNILKANGPIPPFIH